MYLMKYGYMDLNGKDPKKSSSLVSTSGLAAYIEKRDTLCKVQDGK